MSAQHWFSEYSSDHRPFFWIWAIVSLMCSVFFVVSGVLRKGRHQQNLDSPLSISASMLAVVQFCLALVALHKGAGSSVASSAASTFGVSTKLIFTVRVLANVSHGLIGCASALLSQQVHGGNWNPRRILIRAALALAVICWTVLFPVLAAADYPSDGSLKTSAGPRRYSGVALPRNLRIVINAVLEIGICTSSMILIWKTPIKDASKRARMLVLFCVRFGVVIPAAGVIRDAYLALRTNGYTSIDGFLLMLLLSVLHGFMIATFLTPFSSLEQCHIDHVALSPPVKADVTHGDPARADASATL